MLTWIIRKYYSSKTVPYFRTLERISAFLTLAGAWSWSKFPAFASFIRDLASFDTKSLSAISISSVSQPSPNDASLTVAKRSVIGFSPYVAIFSRAYRRLQRSHTSAGTPTLFSRAWHLLCIFVVKWLLWLAYYDIQYLHTCNRRTWFFTGFLSVIFQSLKFFNLLLRLRAKYPIKWRVPSNKIFQ